MNKIAFLLSEGYQLGRVYQNTETARHIPKEFVVVTNAQGVQTEYCATSTRIVLIGRELPGGALGDEYGIVCSQDTRSSKFENTLGGGRLEPYDGEFRTEGDEGAEESVLECLLREVQEELGLTLLAEEVTLIGLRTITEDGSGIPKTIDGRICVDAYFCGFVDERLAVHCEHNGETGDRRVLSPEELLLMPPRASGGKRPLPQTQRLAVATALITISDLWKDVLPAPIAALVTRALPLAQQVYRSSGWTKNFIPLIQQS